MPHPPDNVDPPDDRDPPPARVGAVCYLNSKPLVDRLPEALAAHGFPDAAVTLDYPSRLADGLAGGSLDLALVPSVAALRPGFAVVGDACVAARGPVRSVRLFFRRPPGTVRTLALDEGSRTSATLARVLLAERFGVDPATEPLPLSTTTAADALAATDADAVLLIGDRAMHDPPAASPSGTPFFTVWDLGGEWLRWTGLPFVFAVWASRAGSEVAAPLAPALSAARDAGVADIEAIAARGAGPLGLTADDAAGYLRRNLHFTLGDAERAGLALFGELAARLDFPVGQAVPDANDQPRPTPHPRQARPDRRRPNRRTLSPAHA